MKERNDFKKCKCACDYIPQIKYSSVCLCVCIIVQCVEFLMDFCNQIFTLIFVLQTF